MQVTTGAPSGFRNGLNNVRSTSKAPLGFSICRFLVLSNLPVEIFVPSATVTH